eukprot:Skav204719  [mRNA]  locus=scaffold1549:143410:146327:+ [translate_table: standard]
MHPLASFNSKVSILPEIQNEAGDGVAYVGLRSHAPVEVIVPDVGGTQGRPETTQQRICALRAQVGGAVAVGLTSLGCQMPWATAAAAWMAGTLPRPLHPCCLRTETVALREAGQGGNLESVKFLLAAEADTSIPEKDGYTPMHGAGFQGRAEIAKLLIAHGLNPSEKHQDGYTPIHRACWGSEQRHADTVRAFLKAGVPYDELADNGQRCMDMTSNKATKKLLERRAAKAQSKTQDL